jgi:hypothetical protein
VGMYMSTGLMGSGAKVLSSVRKHLR